MQKFKYRVKFKCYQWNTGDGRAGCYIDKKDFDTLLEAKSFSERVDQQLAAWDSPNWNAFEESEKYIEIESGFIASKAEIVKFFPSYEEPL